MINELKAEAAKLRAELAVLGAKQQRLQAILNLLSLYGEKDDDILKGAAFSDLGLVEAVLSFLKRQQGAFTAREIRDAILTNGFQSDSPNLQAMVQRACERKSDREDSILIRGERDGVRTYRARTPFDDAVFK